MHTVVKQYRYREKFAHREEADGIKCNTKKWIVSLNVYWVAIVDCGINIRHLITYEKPIGFLKSYLVESYTFRWRTLPKIEP